MTKQPYPLVFIRGLLRSQWHWGDFRTKVVEQFPDRQCLFLDIPGNGECFQQKSPCQIRQMTLALITQVNVLNIVADKVDLVSISMGGMIALDWANYAPEQINSLVLINTSLKNFSPFYQRLQPKSWWLLVTMLFKNKHQKERQIYQLTSNFSVAAPYVSEQEKRAHQQVTITHWLKLVQQQPVKFINGLRQLIAAANFTLTKKPKVPITLLVSECDQLVAKQCSEQIAHAWQLELVIHPWAGHDIALDDPHWLCQKLGKKVNTEKMT